MLLAPKKTLSPIFFYLEPSLPMVKKATGCIKWKIRIAQCMHYCRSGGTIFINHRDFFYQTHKSFFEVKTLSMNGFGVLKKVENLLILQIWITSILSSIFYLFFFWKKSLYNAEKMNSGPEVGSPYENSYSGHQPTGIQCFMKWSKANILFFSDPLPRFTLPPSDHEFNSATLAWRVSHQKWMTSKVKKAKLWIHSVHCAILNLFYSAETYNLSI